MKDLSRSIKPGPLSNVNVLDFTWVLAGPHATKTLADMDATVFKIEHFKNGSTERHQALQVKKMTLHKVPFISISIAGKKVYVLTLKTPEELN